MKPNFGMEFTSFYERAVAKQLSEIEKEDANICASCGGEDCICCEIYHDRQKWVSPAELFGHEYGDPMYDDYDYWCDDDEEDDDEDF